MNREILFRGKCAQSGEWVEGDLIHGIGNKQGNIYILPNKTNLAYVKHCDPLDGVRVDIKTVGQFTELLDKNGKKIFENDLLGCWVKDVNKKDKQLLCRVAFNNGSFVVDISRYLNGKLFSDLKTYLEDYVVVGNIHDNADL